MMNIKQIVKEIFSSIKRDWYLPVTEYQVYSEQEQVVGIWMGKPLYRKTFNAVLPPSIPINNWINVSGVVIDNADNVFVSSSFVIDEENYSIPLSYGAYLLNRVTSDGQYQIFTPNSNGATWAHNRPIIVTIQYTKTTDALTTKKVPFEPLIEYSTDEKMIGYWVDGKPIYRKVINLMPSVSLAKNGWSIIAGGFDSSYDLIDCKLILSKIYGRMIAIPFESNIEKSSGNLRVWDTTADADVTSAIIEYTKTTDQGGS